MALVLLGSALLRPAARASEIAAKPPPAVPNSECLDCHVAEFKSRKKGQPKEWVGVKPEAYAHSAHRELACVECHTSITEPEHPAKLPKVDCRTCHEKTGENHAFHPRLALARPPIHRSDDASEPPVPLSISVSCASLAPFKNKRVPAA